MPTAGGGGSGGSSGGIAEGDFPAGPNLLPGERADGGGQKREIATVAGGCFWGVERLFREEFKTALRSTSVGYIGGSSTTRPTYRAVCGGKTGHAEALQMEFYPEKVSYKDLLRYFFSVHDPTTPNRQGNDVGSQYRSAIFVHSPSQREEAENVRAEMAPKWKREICTSIEEAPADAFWRAETYHQLYLEKNPGGYCNHRRHF